MVARAQALARPVSTSRPREQPNEFLSRWRMALAADLILDPTETVASVAARVGYGSPFALGSRAQTRSPWPGWADPAAPGGGAGRPHKIETG